MTLLINLPCSIAGELLGTWLDLKTLVNLDSAFCNREFRQNLLELLRSSSCSLKSQVKDWGKGIVAWLLARQLKLTNLKLFSSSEDPHIISYLRHFGDIVRNVACNNSDFVASYARNLTSLSYFDLPVTARFSEGLWFNRQLRELRLYQVNTLEVVHFDEIKLVHLKLLSLVDSSVSDEILIAIVSGSVYLTHIDLSGCKGITDAGLIALGQHCHQLRCVGLFDLSVSDGALSTIVQLCPQIAHLNIGRNKVVTDAGILALAQGLTNLRSLEVDGCIQLTDTSLLHLVTHCAHTLEILHMCDLHKVRVSVLTSFLQQCTKLHTLGTNLQLYKCHQTIIPHMCNLKTLYLAPVTDDMLCEVAQHCTYLEVLDITAYPVDAMLYPPSDENSVDEDMMYASTEESMKEAPTYSGKGLLALMHGLPHLRVLGVDESYLVKNCLVELAQYLWQALRPRLVITSSTEPFVYDVLRQTL